MSNVALTVLLATRNGENVLPRILEGYCRVEQSSFSWKMVIVDNGSSDQTSAILASFKNRLPLETIQQQVAGKNRALNSGLTALEGQLAIITDDDAIPDSSFLTAWSKYLDKCQEYELLGGSIIPRFEVAPPRWLFNDKDKFDLLFATRDLPEGPIRPEEIFGPNMAVRSSVFARGFRFNEDIGPNGSDPLYPMGSETEFCCRVAQNGAQAWFAKQPRVQHIVRANQLETSYWAKRAYRHGRGTAQRIWELGLTAPSNASRPIIIDKLARLRHRLRMLSPFPSQRINSIWGYNLRRGFQDEWTKRQSTKLR